MTRKFIFLGTILLSIFFLVGCAAAENPAVLPNQNLVFTQAVETLVAQLTPPSPTMTAAALAAEKAVKAATPTPVATATLTPTPTVLPSPTFPPVALFRSDISMYCLAGPENGYGIVGYMAAGQEAVITGQSNPAGWWQIQNPQMHRNAPIEYCWVWAKGGVVSKSGMNIPVVDTPPLATPAP